MHLSDKKNNYICIIIWDRKVVVNYSYYKLHIFNIHNQIDSKLFFLFMESSPLFECPLLSWLFNRILNEKDFSQYWHLNSIDFSWTNLKWLFNSALVKKVLWHFLHCTEVPWVLVRIWKLYNRIMSWSASKYQFSH